MKRILSTIGICACMIMAFAGLTVNIPLTHGNVISDSATMTASTDDSGSSTVDPIDPNQAKAELTANTLKVYEGLEGNVQIKVENRTHRQVVLQTSFDESVTITLTDTAQYAIHLFHPEIGYVHGTFRYPADNAKKMMQNGQMFIRLGNHFYSPTGTKIQ